MEYVYIIEKINNKIMEGKTFKSKKKLHQDITDERVKMIDINGNEVILKYLGDL